MTSGAATLFLLAALRTTSSASSTRPLCKSQRGDSGITLPGDQCETLVFSLAFHDFSNTEPLFHSSQWLAKVFILHLFEYFIGILCERPTQSGIQLWDWGGDSPSRRTTYLNIKTGLQWNGLQLKTFIVKMAQSKSRPKSNRESVARSENCLS